MATRNCITRPSSQLADKPSSPHSHLLTAYLKAVKKRHPRSDTVIVVPDARIQYEQIVRVMDASREIPSGEGEKKNYLFPKVVVASTHR